MDNWYAIENLEDFVNHTRTLVFYNFGNNLSDTAQDEPEGYEPINLSEEEQQELDTILSQDESMTITKALIKQQFNKKSKKKRYVISDEMFLEMITKLNDRMTSNLLNSLVNKGWLETAYDDKANDFIFWIKDNEKTETD